MGFARGKKAYGFCDRTGFRYPLRDLVYEYVHGVRTGLRVGKDVVNPDQPQNFIGEVDTTDFQGLFDPRPDPRDGEGLTGFNPVGNPENYVTTVVGNVVVIT